MKKNLFIFFAVLTALSLSAFGVIKWNVSESKPLEPSLKEPIASKTADAFNITTVREKVQNPIFTDFIYDIGPRFGSIKKGEIDKARSIDAFFDEDKIQSMVSLKSVNVIIIIDDKRSDIRETGYSKALTKAQMKLLQSSNYSTNFLIRVDYEQRNKETGILEDSYSTPHLTIVPEKQATYSDGNKTLKKYLKNQSEAARANVDPDKLKPAKLFFTITKNGTIENIKLDRSSGYPLVDKTMIELISKTPGTWEPAENMDGEKVDQELVVSFGLMGC